MIGKWFLPLPFIFANKNYTLTSPFYDKDSIVRLTMTTLRQTSFASKISAQSVKLFNHIKKEKAYRLMRHAFSVKNYLLV